MGWGLRRQTLARPEVWGVTAAVVLALLPWLREPSSLPFSRSSDLLRHYLPFKQVLYRLWGLQGGHSGGGATDFWGFLAGWDPYTLAGHPLSADPGYGAFYPPGWIFLLGPPEHLFTVFFAGHILLGALLASGCMRALGGSRAASALVGLTYALNLKAVGTWYAGFATMIPAQAWLPGAFWGLTALMQAEGWRSRLLAGLGLGVCLGLQVLAGDAQLALTTASALGVFLLLMPLPPWGEAESTGRAAGRLPVRRWVLLLSLLGAGSVALAVSAPLWRQAGALTAASVRSSGVPFPVAMQMASPPAHLPGMLFPALSGSDASGTWRGPDAFWETAFGPGTVVWLLALLGLLRWGTDRRLLPLLGLCWGVVLLSFGGYGPLAPLLYWVAPGWDHFRGPARALPLLSLGLGLVAGIMLDVLTRAHPEGASGRSGLERSLLRRLAIGLLLLAGGALGWLVFSREALTTTLQAVLVARDIHGVSDGQVGARAWRELALGLGGVGGVAVGILLLLRVWRRPRWMAWGLVGLTALELIVQAVPHLEARPLDAVLPPHPLWEALKAQTQRSGITPPGRILDLSGALSDLVAAVHGLPLVNGMNPLILRRTYQYLQAVQGEPVEVPLDRPVYGALIFGVKAPELLGRLRVDTLLVEPDAERAGTPLPGFSRAQTWRDITVWQQFRGQALYPRLEQWVRDEPSPAVWWTSQVRRTPEDPTVALERVRGAAGERLAYLEPLTEAPLPPHQRGAPGGGGPAAGTPPGSSSGTAAIAEPIPQGEIPRLELVQWAPTEQQIAIQGERAGVVVASEVVAPGWRVWVDDAPAPALIADTLLRAVWVPPGRHRITWRYRP